MKLSVAMITYNHERFIAQAIDSVLAQNTRFDYELVIGEDCSTDGTRSIIMDYQRCHPTRIVALLRTRNIGALPNFAKTISACRGDYVAFLEGDDYWTSINKLQTQVDFLDANPDRSICCHRVQVMSENDCVSSAIKTDVFPTRAAGSYSIEDLLKENFIMTCSMVLRRELIPPFPASLLKMKLGDWPLCAMVARHGKIELLDAVMATYRVHMGSTWSMLPFATRLREAVRMLKTLDKELGYQYKDIIHDRITRPYMELAIEARANGNRLETAKHLVSFVRNSGHRLSTNRQFVGLIAYTIMGSWYKIFSRAKSSRTSRQEPDRPSRYSLRQ